jgi:exodeoxyribonuclease V alpha subunit
MHDHLTGQLESITYTNTENGFTVAKIKVSGRHDLVTILGNLTAPTPGEILKMTGEWSRHPRYGRQFKIASYETSTPASVHGIEKYLGSGMIKGFGPELARRIVKKFGPKTLKIIDKDIEKLAEVDGIGQKRIAMIQKAWEAQKQIRGVMIFLQAHGVGSGYATRIFMQYGQRAVAVVKENPFRLATDIHGFGFLTADRIAKKLGFPADSELRVAAGILYVLNQLADEGNVFYPYEPLVAKCREIIIEDLNQSLTDFKENNKAVYLAPLHVCEIGVAGRLQALLSADKTIRTVQIDKALDWVQRQLSITLAKNQVAAARAALVQKVLVITGGPGTGKTTIINAVLKIYARLKVRTMLAAPTGRASKRMSEACRHSARTIHRMLEFSMAKGGFQRNGRNPLECDLLVIDEASMIDTVLMHHLMKAVPTGAVLVLVGDVNQLPSVGAGNILKDIIDSGAVPVVALNEIFRQARQSRIIVNAHKINSGFLPDLVAPGPDDALASDFFFIQQEDPEKVVDIILALTKTRIPRRFGFDPFNDIQVLTPMHRGTIGAANLNDRLQRELNPGQDRITRGDRGFRIHDKVMQIKNNYDKTVFNGDIGKITRIDAFSQKVVIEFDEREVEYGYAELDEIVLAYAISVHKSQGSEYPVVVIPIHTQHYILLQRNLIYTAVTRGRKLVVMVGTPKALAIGVKNDKIRKRHTYLKYRLAGL